MPDHADQRSHSYFVTLRTVSIPAVTIGLFLVMWWSALRSVWAFRRAEPAAASVFKADQSKTA